ncbi:Metallo-dependent phosphatase [Wallemia mellicola]|nr:Metallo-dependent phosphatase [Wallemia mellicola]
MFLPLFSLLGATAASSLTYQQRLAYAGDDGVNIAFNTKGNNTLNSTPTVFYGTSKDDLTMQAQGFSSIYQTSLSTTHKVKLRNLNPDTRYFYQTCLDINNECPRSDILSFKTTVSAGDQREFKFAVLGDMGVMGPLGGFSLLNWQISNFILGLSTEAPSKVEDYARLDEGERSTMKALIDNKDKYQFIVHNGDHAYADDAGKEITAGYIEDIPDEPLLQQMSQTYELILETYFNQTSQFASSTPYMVGVGNHEQLLTEGKEYTDPETGEKILIDDIPKGQRNFAFYKDRYFMPGDESGGLDNFWWSIETGPLKYIQINTETDLGEGVKSPDEKQDPAQVNQGEPNQQIKWLEDQLKTVDRDVTPWVVVAGHRPWYGSLDDCEGCADIFDPLFTKYNVDLVLHGHIHLYERLAPISGGKKDNNGLNNPKAPWYIISGAAGHYDGLDEMPDEINENSEKIIQGEFGYDEITIHNRTHLTHAFIASKNDTLFDVQTLYKAHKFN